MLNSRSFDAGKFIETLKPDVFAISLHWLVHVQGSIEVARICKKYRTQNKTLRKVLVATLLNFIKIKSQK
jgi:hypothetical protein